MATEAEREKRIAAIRELPARLEEAIAGLSEEQLDRIAGGEGWSIRQIVHHLADAHLNAFTRMKLMLTESKPILKPFDQEAWALLADTTQLPVGPSLQIVKGVHQRWARLLDSLREPDWQRVGVHLERGLVSVDDQLQTYARHCDDHLGQIGRIKAAL